MRFKLLKLLLPLLLLTSFRSEVAVRHVVTVPQQAVSIGIATEHVTKQSVQSTQTRPASSESRVFHAAAEDQDGSILQLIATANSPPILFVFIGESNSTGLATNTYATTHELSVRPAVQLLDHVGLDSFWDLHIGVNNQIENVQFGGTNPLTGTPYWYSTHGWELELANEVEAGVFHRAQVYLAKCGQGGTVTANWDSSATYMGIHPYQVAVRRVDSARSIIHRKTGQWPITVPIFNIGINEGGIGNPSYITNYENLITRFRRDVGLPDMGVIILNFESIPGMSGSISAINGIRNDLPNVSIVSSAGATTLLADQIHWEYPAAKINAGRIFDTARVRYTR